MRRTLRVTTRLLSRAKYVPPIELTSLAWACYALVTFRPFDEYCLEVPGVSWLLYPRGCAYAAEFFASLFSDRTVRPYIKSLNGLQDELGFTNNAAVADRLLGDVSASRPELSVDVGFVKGFLAARATTEDKKIIKLWRQFERIGIPRLR